MNMNCGIYKIVNLINYKIYVGSASDIKKRWSIHISYLSTGKHKNNHLQSAWNKYGAENFKFEIIEYCEKRKLIKREQYYMNLFEVCQKGYNILPVAGSCLGYRHSNESLEKMRKAQLGHSFSEDTLKKMSISLKGRKAWNKGKKGIYSKETLKKISESRIKGLKSGRIVPWNKGMEGGIEK